ncbi:MAG: hypothetical protein IH585_05810 [Anaerolineaceae bacterium]|nr:hypothetical protein [Anaerolineaceae bacterium]
MFLKKGVTYYYIVSLWLFFFILTACASTESTPSLEKTKGNPNILTATPNFSEIQTNPIVSSATLQPTSTRKVYPKKPTETGPLPLSLPGPFHVGIRRNINYVDISRNNREVSLTIWYPAIRSSESDPVPSPDALPDLSTAPYPVIMSSSKLGFDFADKLVSYGFVYIGINRIDTYRTLTQEAIDQPLDIIFALNQVADSPIHGLDGMMDIETVGTLGYSFDGTNSLLLSGARIDPKYYLSYCQEAPNQQPPLEIWYQHYYCDLSSRWDELSEYVGKDITESEDDLWQPITDDRIKAVMPMAPDGAWLLGETGLSAADRAVLMIQASKDSQYQPIEGKFIFEHLGSMDKTMVSFIGRKHLMILEPIQKNIMAHFAVAFFSHQLQGKEDMAYYYSEEFIEQYSDLAYGFYEEK